MGAGEDVYCSGGDAALLILTKEEVERRRGEEKRGEARKE